MENLNSVTVVGFWVSPFVHRVRWALKLKEIEYEYIEEDIFNRTTLLSELNPVYSKVPVLVHNGKPLPESSVILEYIDETWRNNPLLPEDPLQRAEAHFWAGFAEEKIFYSGFLVALRSEDDEEKQKGVKLTIEALEKMEEKLEGKTFFGGETIGYLDLMMGWVTYFLPAYEEVASVKFIEPSKFPAITAWTNNFLDHPVVKAEYLPSKTEIFTYLKWLLEVFKPSQRTTGSSLVLKKE